MAKIIKKILKKRFRIRKLIPEECFFLMGMTKEDCIKCRNLEVSDSQLFRLAGNGLVTNCVQLIMEHLYKNNYDKNYICTDEKMINEGYGIDEW